MPQIERMMLVACVSAMALTACDKKEDAAQQVEARAEAALKEGTAVEFVVDGKGVRYLYRTGEGQNRSALKAASIPPGYRGAVAVFSPQVDQARAAGDTLYVADLFGAAPGDKRVAFLTSRDEMQRASSAGVKAARYAVDTVEHASLIAELSPGSEARSGEYVSFLIEDGDKVERKRARIERAKRNPTHDTLPTIPKNKREDGVVGKAWKRIFGDSAAEEASPELEANQQWREVTMYSTSWCPACKAAKRWLDDNDVPHEYVDVEAEPGRAQEAARVISEHGLRPGAIPTFAIGDDEAMQGWNARRFTSLARK